jgi:hypothetical protein
MIGGQKEAEDVEETPDILPNISDDQIDTLYLMMIPLDSKFDAFAGSKREYVFTVYNLMKNFLEKSQLTGKGRGTLSPKLGSENPGKQASQVEEPEVEETGVKKTSSQEERQKEVLKRLDDLVKKTDATEDEVKEYNRLKRMFETKIDSIIPTQIVRQSGVSFQEIYNLANKFKDEVEPLKEIVENKDSNLLKCVAYPMLGFAKLGDKDTLEAYKQRTNFLTNVAKKGHSSNSEASLLAEVLVKNHLESVKNYDVKEFELFKQNVLPSYKYDGMDGYNGNNTIEIKTSFDDNNNYTSGHKFLLQLLCKKRFPNTKQEHILTKNKLKQSDFITKYSVSPNDIIQNTSVYSLDIDNVEPLLSDKTKKDITDFYNQNNIENYKSSEEIVNRLMDKNNLRKLNKIGDKIIGDLVNKGTMEQYEENNKYYAFTDEAYKQKNFMKRKIIKKRN